MQELRALTPFPEDLTLIPSTYRAVYNQLYLRDAMPSSGIKGYQAQI